MSSPRTIILHYHLFKNAGTSVDDVLKENFGDKWVTREFQTVGQANTDSVVEWIKSQPDAIAFSSHTMSGPLPVIEGVDIISLMILRDPIARIQSAYRFERKQVANTWGAQLAKTEDFPGYVRARLNRPGDRQCRNFQTERLSSLVIGPEPDLTRARTALQKLSVVGRVEQFDQAMALLAQRVKPHFPDFDGKIMWSNRTRKDGEAMDAALLKELQDANADDLALLAGLENERAQAASAG